MAGKTQASKGEVRLRSGRREANKADKLQRIKSAIRDLFVEKGFDATTMRDIAARANVGFGTLFDYASNKREFLFLLFNPELETALETGLGAAAQEPKFLDKLMALFGAYYALYARDRALSRAVLRELTFFSEGAEARKFIAHRAAFVNSVADLVRQGQASGELAKGDAVAASQIIFALFAWEVRRWLAAEAPSIARGLGDLRRLLSLQIAGFSASEKAGARRETAT